MTIAAAPVAAQGASLLGKALPRPKTSHPYIVGIIFIVIGVAGMIGSITGELPAMIAALFDPNVLTDVNDKSPTESSIATGVADLIINPGQFLTGQIGNVL
jgi:hypothetical protein